ncbi:hypothetical protein [Azospirillum argentinense]|uniref:hypothetical protein n=1 Tax=Azospirillum argentinense TaxID=2970906 RepID=UPI0011F25EBA|nr:hypothetical protein [Azospirillum argentinense]
MACILAGTLAACSNVNLDAAKALGRAGQSAAGSAAEFADVPRSKYQAYIEGLAFISAYPPPPPKNAGPNATAQRSCNPYGLTPLGETGQALAARYFELMDRRRAMLDKLSDVYGAFEALASYGAAEAVESGIAAFSAAANDYIRAVDPSATPVKTNVSGTIAAAGGMLVEDAQKSKVRQASIAIRERLEAVLTYLNREDSASAWTEMRGEQVRNGHRVAAGLWCAGLLDASPIIDSLASGYGMKISTAKSGGITADDPRLRQGVEGVLSIREEQANQAITSGYNAMTASIGDLITEHRKVEAGVPIDLEFLQTRIARLQSLVETLTSAE